MSDPSPDSDGEPDPVDAETNGDEGNDQDSLDVQNENYVQVLDPLGDPESDDLVPALWGRFWGISEGHSMAFYWSFNPGALSNSSSFAENNHTDEPSPDEESDGDEDGNGGEENDRDETSGELFDDALYAIFGNPSSLEEYDPGLRRVAFKKRLLDYTIDDAPVPGVILEDMRDTMESYLEKPKIIWLRDFIKSNEHSEINGWFTRLLEEFDDDEYRYQLRAQLIDPDAEEDELLEQGPIEEPPGASEEDETEEESSVRTLDISVMTDPTNGVQSEDLAEGMEIFFRIVGNVDFLPEELIDRDRQEPASTPMTGSIVSIESNPEIPGDRDADPKNYRMIEVEIEPEIHGEGLAFKDDRIKVPVEDEEEFEFETGDVLLLGVLVSILLLIGLLILYL